ncbi:MAG: DUF898 family protein [Pseudorhodoplanes sp.]
MHDVDPSLAAPASFAPPDEATSVVFADQRSDFISLVMRGAALEFVTAGFYRFWLATDMRRHLWSRTSVGGDAPEYNGTAKELFIGFLFAMAILLPIYVIYFLLGLEAERMQAFASIPLGLFFYLFMQFAVYRARRYRLTRTVWRGVRFGMGGSGWNYAWRAALWTLFATITLGLALPWRQAALERFKMRHTAYGDLQGGFVGTGWEFFKRGWWIWLLMWPSVFLLVPLPFLWGAFKAVEWRWWISGLRFGEVRCESRLPGSALFDLYWKVIGWSTFLSVVLSTIIGLVAGMYASLVGDKGADTTPADSVLAILQPGVIIPAAILYIVAALLFVAVTRIYLIHDIWKRVAETTTIHNLSAADNVNVQGTTVNAIGEGFADSLDIAGF